MLDSQNVQCPTTWNRLEEEISPVPSVPLCWVMWRKVCLGTGSSERSSNLGWGRRKSLQQGDWSGRSALPTGAARILERGMWSRARRMDFLISPFFCCHIHLLLHNLLEKRARIMAGCLMPSWSVGSYNKWQYIPAVGCPFSKKWQRSVGWLWKGQPSCCWPMQVSLWCHNGISQKFFFISSLLILQKQGKNYTQCIYSAS